MTLHSTTDQINWLNILKGIGIVAVAIGHIYSGKVAKFMYIFHMPLFFYLGGYLLSFRDAAPLYFKKKTTSLLIPYFVFLAIIYYPSAIQLFEEATNISSIIKIIIKPIYGGQALSAELGAFWFVTCFFLAQQITRQLIIIFDLWIVISLAILSLCLAYLNQFLPAIFYPWAANVVFMAFPMILAGYCHRRFALNINIILLGFILSLLLITEYIYNFPILDMKNAKYGIPVFSILLSAVSFLVLEQIARLLVKIPVISNCIEELGKASLVIMFLHQFIQLSIQRLGYENETIRFSIALLGSYLIYRIAGKSKLGQTYLLGGRST